MTEGGLSDALNLIARHPVWSLVVTFSGADAAGDPRPGHVPSRHAGDDGHRGRGRGAGPTHAPVRRGERRRRDHRRVFFLLAWRAVPPLDPAMVAAGATAAPDGRRRPVFRPLRPLQHRAVPVHSGVALDGAGGRRESRACRSGASCSRTSSPPLSGLRCMFARRNWPGCRSTSCGRATGRRRPILARACWPAASRSGGCTGGLSPATARR